MTSPSRFCRKLCRAIRGSEARRRPGAGGFGSERDSVHVGCDAGLAVRGPLVRGGAGDDARGPGAALEGSEGDREGLAVRAQRDGGPLDGAAALEGEVSAGAGGVAGAEVDGAEVAGRATRREGQGVVGCGGVAADEYADAAAQMGPRPCGAGPGAAERARAHRLVEHDHDLVVGVRFAGDSAVLERDGHDPRADAARRRHHRADVAVGVRGLGRERDQARVEGAEVHRRGPVSRAVRGCRGR